jgi:GTP cyclohydrolase I
MENKMSEKTLITYERLQQDAHTLAKKLNKDNYTGIYGIPRGGVPVAVFLSMHLGLPLVDTISEDTLIVDDLVDSGKTIEQYRGKNDVAVLYRKSHSPIEGDDLFIVDTIDAWIEFPYEDTQTDVEENFRRILEHLGEDPTREGLVETPKRYIKFMKQFLTKDDFNFTAFDAEGYDEMIVQKDIPFFSLCEHHIAPFFGTATVAYIPGKKIVGLSKLARTVKHYAANFQNQERITSQVAERLEKELNPVGVAVTISARHFCMEMRGVKTHDVATVTTKLTGAFKTDEKTRAEYMGHLKD